MAEYYLAVDIGASSGRHILGHLEDGRIVLEEVYRFENGMEKKDGHLCWNLPRLFHEIKEGLKACRAAGKIPKSMGIDTWAVDYVLWTGRTGSWETPMATGTAEPKAWTKRYIKSYRRTPCMPGRESRNRCSIPFTS